MLLYDLFRASVSLADPGAAAVTFSDTTNDLTYARLDALSDAVAAALTPVVSREFESHRTPLVGLCCPPSPALVVGLLGVLNIKCAYVPLPTTAVDTHRLLVSSVGLTALLVHADYLGLCLHRLAQDEGEGGWRVLATGPPELCLHLIHRHRPSCGAQQQPSDHETPVPLHPKTQVAAAW